MLTARRVVTTSETNVLLHEQWDGGAVNTAVWAATDSGSKLSVANSALACSGGLASPAWDDPRVSASRAFKIRNGLTAIAHANFSSLPAGLNWDFGFDNTSPVAASLRPGWYVTTTTAGADQRTSGSVNLPLTLATSTDYVFSVRYWNGYWRWEVSTDDGKTWSLYWVQAVADSGTLYAGISNRQAAFTCNYFKVLRKPTPWPAYSGTPAAPTPSLTDLLTDAGIETWTNPTTPTAYFKDALGTSTVNQEATTFHGGANSARFDVDASSSAADIYIKPAKASGTIFHIAAWLYASASGKTGRVDVGGVNGRQLNPGTTWTQYYHTLRSIAANAYIYWTRASAASASLYWDDLEASTITLASTLSLASDPGTKNGIVDSAPTLTAGTWCGHAICLDSETTPTYGIFAYHDGTNAHLDKCENGTWTSLINTAATYVAAAACRIVKVGSAVALYYNSAKVGADQTVDTTLYGTKVAGFSTFATNTPGQIDVHIGVGV